MTEDQPPTAMTIGASLRQLADHLEREIQAAAKPLAGGFEPRWIGVFKIVHETPWISVSELARRTGLSHPAVSQIRSALESAGLVMSRDDPNDGRSRLLGLTEAGEAQARHLMALWTAISAATQECLQEGSPSLIAELTGLQKSLARRRLRDRIQSLMPT